MHTLSQSSNVRYVSDIPYIMTHANASLWVVLGSSSPVYVDLRDLFTHVHQGSVYGIGPIIWFEVSDLYTGANGKSSLYLLYPGPLLLTWINFNRNMQRYGMDLFIQSQTQTVQLVKFRNGYLILSHILYHYLCILELKLIHISRVGLWWPYLNQVKAKANFAT